MAIASSGYRFVAPRGAGVQARTQIRAGGGGSFLRWADGGRTDRPSHPAHRYFPNPPDEERPDSQPDNRVLPPGRHGGDDVRPPGRQRRQAGASAARGKRITIDTLDRIQAYIAASTPG